MTLAVLGQSLGGLSGTLTDPQGKAVPGAEVRLLLPDGKLISETKTAPDGAFRFGGMSPGVYRVTAVASGFEPVSKEISIAPGQTAATALQFSRLESRSQSIVITARTLEPEVDLRNAESFNRTLFTRDDQVFQQLNAGIDAGQHEGGGKSLEIRRFGFNLDHGGVNGGLKVLVDDVQQNQGTQGHGQGYLGALKALSPELIQDVTIINGPFSRRVWRFQRPRRGAHPPARILARSIDGAAAGRELQYRPRISRVQPRRREGRCLCRLRRVVHRWPVRESRPIPPRQPQRQLHPVARSPGESWASGSSSAATIFTRPARFRSTS